MSEAPKPFEWTLPCIWRGMKSTLKFLGEFEARGDELAMLFLLFFVGCMLVVVYAFFIWATHGWLLIIALAFVLAFDLLRLIGRGMQ